jgi:lauroyl/myristoyl acyltransferase
MADAAKNRFSLPSPRRAGLSGEPEIAPLPPAGEGRGVESRASAVNLAARQTLDFPLTALLRRGAGLLRRLGDHGTGRGFWQYWVADVAVGAGSYALHSGLRRLPFAACSAFGGGLGLFVGRLRGAFRPDAPARATFARLRPESVAKGDLDRAMARMYDNIGRVYAEYNILDLLWAAGHITVTGQEHLAACRERNRPILVFGVHLASWEVIGAALLGLGYDVHTLYRPAKNRFQDRIVVAVRRHGGAELVPPGPQGARQAYRVLVERRGVFLTWADARRLGSASVPTFGRPMPHQGNLSAVVRLARATGANPIPAYVERQAGARFHTTFGPPVELIRDGDDKADFLANMARLDELITSIVVPRLDQWWMLPYVRFD